MSQGSAQPKFLLVLLDFFARKLNFDVAGFKRCCLQIRFGLKKLKPTKKFIKQNQLCQVGIADSWFKLLSNDPFRNLSGLQKSVAKRVFVA